MSIGHEIKDIRQHCFLSQKAFAEQLNVSFASVNRWESDRVKPNLVAMKSMKDFCNERSIDFSNLETAWFAQKEDGNNDS